LDAIIKPKQLIDKAIELGFKGVAITDHESLSGAIKANAYAQEVQDKIKVVLGNEIYLCPDRTKGQRYWHFILLAKNKLGFKALRELSSIAWLNSFQDRGMERVVTTYADLERIVKKYPNTLIASTACLGSQLSGLTLKLDTAEKTEDVITRELAHTEIVNFMLWCKQLFGDDFYVEMQPAQSKEQIIVNKRLRSIAKAFDCKMIVTTDSHYLEKKDRFVHKAFLNSKAGEREVDSFYEYAYLQNTNEIIENLEKPCDFSIDFINEMFHNTIEIIDKVENYSLFHSQQIPNVKLDANKVYEPAATPPLSADYPTLNKLYQSNDIYDRSWVNQCVNKLKEKGLYNKQYLNRLEEEADVKQTIGEKLETNLFRYPLVLQHYIDMMWECGSSVGAGRGSSSGGLNHYLLSVTQLNPIRWNMPFFRYLNKERIQLPDIDIDLCPSKRPLILQKIKEERAAYFNDDIDEVSRKNLGCTLVATFGTMTSKSAILASCRGYRSEDYPDGIDVDTAQYLASLVPSERGKIWSIDEVLHGNAEKGRKPVKDFIQEIKKYPKLIDIIINLEGLVDKRSSHASGVVLFDNDPYEFQCFMRTPKGEIITQWDLEDVEAAGSTKYDFLLTSAQDMISTTIRLLQQHGKIDKNFTLREAYDKYLHPETVDLTTPRVWEHIKKNDIFNLFQFDSPVGAQGIAKIQPNNILELSAANGLIRLMTAEKGEETPLEKYVRFKKNPDAWYEEMIRAGLTGAEEELMEKYIGSTYGVGISQEQLMLALMDKDICGFSLKESNTARKIVAKKHTEQIAELKEDIFKKAKNPQIGKYVWSAIVAPQLGYSFSDLHAIAYSLIGYQEAILATKWNPIYWNTACLIVNSGSLEPTGVEDKDKGTDYEKIAKAIGVMQSKGILVSPIDINQSDFSFSPVEDKNLILYGLKAVSGINDEIINQIIASRPYKNINDFLSKVKIKKSQMIPLIKGGAFDNIDGDWGKKIDPNEPRRGIMAYYISITSKPKKKLTLQNFNGLLTSGLIPDELEEQKVAFILNKTLKTTKFFLDDKMYNLYKKFFNEELLSFRSPYYHIDSKTWEKIYKKTMNTARNWLVKHQHEALRHYNTLLFQEEWNKQAKGNISAWEMEALCFYHHNHELLNVDKRKYGLVDFSDLPSEPLVDYWFRGKIPIYKLFRIVGTVIGKNDIRSSVSLLTTEGVLNVKFAKGYYANYKKQISEIQEDGSKKVMDKSWFKRGTKIMVTGYRREDTFIAKTYKITNAHQLYKISAVSDDGTQLEVSHERFGEGDE
jgi:DNA polymerase-3 subunit alpha